MRDLTKWNDGRYEYMTQYIESAKQVGRLENAIGWYHSHPGQHLPRVHMYHDR